MSAETAAVVVAAMTTLGTVLAAYIAHGARRAAHGAHDASRTAAHAADRAAANTAPVSNGFAGMVRDNLTEILAVATEARDVATRTEDKVDRHLEAHANAHLQAVPTVATVRGGRTW